MTTVVSAVQFFMTIFASDVAAIDFTVEEHTSTSWVLGDHG